jgi:hypothetical protein
LWDVVFYPEERTCITSIWKLSAEENIWIGETRNAYRSFVEKPLGYKLFGRLNEVGR